ncbi:alpha/beta fold hydrolase [Candidatus Viadribacter manganicus]|uniref:Epoxide hydrolase n=1 Tax=Candidatus Viadribacter manganicus TaxID=1759059 RepID=A0A1B1AG27_9PROT|nr:alpha/beta hydrolase [Candidatus Viadribacter manganicus]ANP45508.1 epoxide hydrolase [Candidatus Viadribacter manganicus]
MKPEFRMIDTNGIKVRAAIQGEGPLVVMVHGFPESWYSWRHQMAPLAAAGFTACAIDVRGYGGSDKPHAVEAYAIKEIAADVAGVIEALSPGKPAVLIGHDWGAPIVWHTAVLHPDKVRAVAGLSVPWFGLPPMSLDALIKAMYIDQGKFFYQAYFKDEGVAEAAFEADVRGGLRKLYYAGSGDSQGYWGGPDKKHGDHLLDGLPDPEPFPWWMTPEDIDYFTAEFTNSGFRGPINRYRNHTRDFEYMSTIHDRVVHQPSLFIVGENDLVLKMFGASAEAAFERMAANTSDHRGSHMIPRIGHWTQQEAPKETTGLLIDWLATL